MRPNSPFSHSSKTRFDSCADLLIALAPVLIWSVFCFGARVVTICAISVAFCFLFDFPVARFVNKLPISACFDPTNAVFGILTAFMMPVSVSLFVPVLGAFLCVVAKNLRIFHGERTFCPFVFSAAALNLLFPRIMTTFTRPFAYFNALSVSIDPQLLKNYHVLSPLQFMADGSVYEDGVMAQLYGFASGCIGEIAVAAIIMGAVWLFVRKKADVMATLSFVGAVALLASAFPSDDAETNYYVYSFLLSGGIVLVSVFAVNDNSTTPYTKTGKLLFGALCGTLTFVLRKSFGGYESAYFSVLLLNAVSPFISAFTRQRPTGVPKKGKAQDALI